MHASSPGRAPKLLLAAKQPSTEEYWIPAKKHTTHPRAKEKINKTLGGAKSCLESNPVPARDVWRAQAKACVHQDSEARQRLSQTCLLVFECLLQRHGSAVTCHGDRGSGCSRPGSCSMWHKPSWRKLPLAPPQSHQADDPQTAEQLYQRSSPTVKKVLGPTTDFPIWGSGKGTENSQ